MDQTNALFAQENKEFRAACEEAGVAPSKRQASRWRMGEGVAFFAKKAAELHNNFDNISATHSNIVSSAKQTLKDEIKNRKGQHDKVRGLITRFRQITKDAKEAISFAEANYMTEKQRVMDHKAGKA